MSLFTSGASLWQKEQRVAMSSGMGYDLQVKDRSLDRLELLERLLAFRAVAQRAAGRRAEDVLQARVVRVAVRAAEDIGLQLHQRRPACITRRRRRESRSVELFPSRRRDAVGRPGVVGANHDLRLL